MIARVLAVAIAAGLIAGLFASLVQSYKVTPLIYQAETFESAGGHDHGAAASAAADHGAGHSHGDGHGASHGGDGGHDAGGWAPSDGLERILFTVLANCLTGIAFALLLVAGFVLWGGEVDWRKGLLWGLGGFAAFALAPAMVLPPEVPGAVAAGVSLRQGLWVLIALLTAAGLALAVFAKGWPLRAVGLVMILAPLAISTPEGDGVGEVPPELSAQFVAASLGAAALFWVALGSVSGHFYRRFLGS
jgi:cobalt transporter subunit CbtA